MGNVVRFKRPNGIKFKAKLHKRWRGPSGVWFLLLAIVGIAAAENFKFESGRSGIGSSFTRSLGAGPNNFGRCFNAGQKNCVVDGDTIRYKGVSIRLADIDTPEKRNPKCASEVALAEKATQRLVVLMNAGSFGLANSGGRDEDRYGRKLRIVQVNGQSVGDTLITEGLARRWDGARRSWCG